MYTDIRQWSKIRRRVLYDGVSRKQVVRDTGISRQTIRKMLLHPTPLPYGGSRDRNPEVGPHIALMRRLLDENGRRADLDMRSPLPGHALTGVWRKRSRYLWLKNERHLSAEQSASLDVLSRMHLKTARAYRLRLAFQDIYDQPSHGWGELILDRWYSWAIRSRLEPMKDAARTIMRHRDGILRWFTSKIANGLIEGINSLVQAAKAIRYTSSTLSVFMKLSALALS
jgi:transposase